MTRKKRGVLVAVAVVAALLAAEVGLHLAQSPRACVQVDNKGAEPIEGLVLSVGPSRAAAPRLEPGGSVKLFLSGRGPGTLQVAFRQRGNGLTGYQLPGFDPALMTEEGARLVLQIRPNEVVRFQDEAEPSTPFGRFVRDSWARFWKSLELPP